MNLAKIGIMFSCIAMLSCVNVFAEPINVQAMQGEYQKVDMNKDATVTSAEMQAYHTKKFSELDKDKSGALDSNELKADKTGMFAASDNNKDGKVNQQEVNSQFKEYYKGMDSNNDGIVTEREFKDYNPLVFRF